MRYRFTSWPVIRQHLVKFQRHLPFGLKLLHVGILAMVLVAGVATTAVWALSSSGHQTGQQAVTKRSTAKKKPVATTVSGTDAAATDPTAAPTASSTTASKSSSPALKSASGATLILSTSSLSIKAGLTATFTVYASNNARLAMPMKSSGPTSMLIDAPGAPDQTVWTMTVKTLSVPPGTYPVQLRAQDVVTHQFYYGNITITVLPHPGFKLDYTSYQIDSGVSGFRLQMIPDAGFTSPISSVTIKYALPGANCTKNTPAYDDLSYTCTADPSYQGLISAIASAGDQQASVAVHLDFQ